MLAFIAVGWLIIAGFTAAVAVSKGRDGLNWFLLGVLGGVFALLAVGFMPKLEQDEYETEVQAAWKNMTKEERYRRAMETNDTGVRAEKPSVAWLFIPLVGIVGLALILAG